MQQQHGQSGAELGIINIQQTSYDERRDNGVNSAGWSTAGRRWGACMCSASASRIAGQFINTDGWLY